MNHIFKWLNDDVQLTTKIYNIEEQFSNGYLFGELLSIFNQQLNFSEDFVNKNTKEFTINNFKMLEPTMKELKIKFDLKIAESIILKKNGAALEVWRQLKDSLSKVNNPIDFIIMKTKGHCNSSNPIKKIEISKQEFREIESSIFYNQLKNNIKSQKETDLENHLKKYEINKFKQEEKVKKEMFLKEKEIKEEKLNKRAQLLDKLQRNVNFYNTNNQIGTEEWKKNNKEKIERERREKEYLLKIKNTKNKIKKMNLEKEKNEVYNEIERFEKRKKEKKKDINVENKNFKINFDINNIKNILNQRELEMHSEKFRKQRDKRARKMIVDLTKTQKEIEIKKRENFLMNKLLQESKQEEEIRYEFYRSKKFKDIIEENRKLRNNHYSEKKKLIDELKIKKEKKILVDLKEEYNKEIENNLNLLEDLKIKNDIKLRDKNYKLCEKIIFNWFELSEVCYEKMENSNDFTINDNLIYENYNLFKNSLDPIKYNDTIVQNNQENENLDLYLDFFIFDYIKKKNFWKNLKNEDYEKNEYDTKLGDILLEINNVVNNDIIKSENNNTDFPNYLPLKLWIVGPNYSGKETISNFLRDKYNLKVFNFESLIKEKISLYDVKKVNKSLKEDELYDKLSKFIFEGKKIPDHISSKFLVNEIKNFFPIQTKENYLKENLKRIDYEINNKKIELKQDLIKKKENSVFHKDIEIKDVSVDESTIPIILPEGFIILDYPHTYEQSMTLEKEISNFLPHDHKSIKDKNRNKKFIMKLMETSKKKIIGKKKQKSGLDLVIMIELENENLFKRAFGNVINVSENSVYHLENNPPETDKYPLVNNLKFLNKINDSIYSTYIKKSENDKNKGSLYNFFDNFRGLKKDSLIKIIKGNNSLTEIINNVDKIIDDLYQIQKTKYLNLKNKKEKEKLELEEKEKLLKEKIELENIKKIREEPIIEEKKDFILNNFSKDENEKIIYKNILNFWKNSNINYMKNIKMVFKEQFESKNYLLQKLKKFRNYLIELLNKEDDRNILLINLQKDFNDLILNNQDLIENDLVKNELYNRVIEFCSEVYLKSLKKSKIIQSENQKFKESLILESEIKKNYNYFIDIVNEEIKLNHFYNIIWNDYYKLKDINIYKDYDKEINLINNNNNDISIENIDNELLKIFDDSKNIINDEVKENPKNPKDNKLKAGNKKNIKVNSFIEEDNEILKIYKDHKNQENLKTIEKINLLYNYFKKEINYLILKFQDSNKLMNNVIEYNLKNEKVNINEIKNILCNFIENECPIQTEINIFNNYFNINQNILNFILKKDPIQDEIEIINKDNFLIKNWIFIKSILEILKDGNNRIETKCILNFFDYIIKYNEIHNILPEKWNSLNYENFEKLVNKLSNEESGFILYEQLITYIILFNSEIVDGKTNDHLNKMIIDNLNEENILTFEAFLKIDTTFDYSQESKNPFNNSKNFDRVKNIKKLIYDVYENENGLFDHNKYLNILKANNLNLDLKNYNNYFELLFN